MAADCVIEAVKEFSRPSGVIVYPATPCGVSSAGTLLAAYVAAYRTDTDSPFGGVIAVNRELDVATAQEMAKLFLELIVAPSFSADAKAILTAKKNLRLLEVPGLAENGHYGGLQLKSVVGGLVVQDRDILEPDTSTWRVVSKVQPTENRQY